MDGDDRRTSHYGQPYQSGVSRSSAGPSMGPPTTDRYSQPATPLRSDPLRHSMTRPYVPSYPGYAYQDQQYAPPSMHGSSPMQGVEMQYSPAYVQDVSRQQALGQPQPHHSYGQFPQGAILPSVPQPSMYDTMPQYQQRQTAAIEAMSSQLGAMPQYMQQGEQSSMPIPSSAAQYSASQAEQAQYPAAGMQRGALPSQYSSSTGEYPTIETQQSQQPVLPPQPSAAEQEVLQEEVRQYEQQLRSTFEAIINGRITEASEKILQVSRWLISAVVPLGLHHDDVTHYDERLALWRRFNLCWEALGQKQRGITEQALRSGRQPTDILSADSIRRLIDELVAMCDQLETYGLVDYEMGIAEEQICHIFTVCLDLLQRNQPGAGSGPSREPP